MSLQSVTRNKTISYLEATSSVEYFLNTYENKFKFNILLYSFKKYFWKFDKDMREIEDSFSTVPMFSCFMQENNVPFQALNKKLQTHIWTSEEMEPWMFSLLLSEKINKSGGYFLFMIALR